MSTDLKWMSQSRKLSELKPATYNPRKLSPEQEKRLTDSIAKFDVCDPIIINADNTIIGGHQRIKVLSKQGVESVDVRVPSRQLSIEEEKELNVRLNKNLGEWDFNLLKDFDMNMLKDVGFDSLELDKIFPVTSDEKDDDVPEVKEETTTKIGDIFQLGRHRVMCGDSTDAGSVAVLMEGKKVDLVFADPPYGISVVQGGKVGGGGVTHFGKVGGNNIVPSSNYKPVENDDTTDTAEKFYKTCVDLEIKNIVLWGGNYFTKFLYPSRCWFIWDKEMTGNFSEAEMAWTSFEKGGVRVFKHLWNGLSRAGERKDELSKRVHPTQKPVGLFVEILLRFDYLKNIFDGFLGSGSTLIACEKTNRICYGMEIDPHYVDVIVNRWEQFTGQKAIKLSGEGVMPDAPHKQA